MNQSEVMVIAIAGGSGSGKTTFARMLQANLGDHMSLILAQDFYYHDLSSQFDFDGGSVNFDHPHSIEFSLMARHLSQLKRGQGIDVPLYDFKTHSRRTQSHQVGAKPIVLVDGILILSQSELREIFDFVFFIDTQEELRFKRRLQRDVKERGRTPEGVYHQFYAQVKPMHDLYVEPSRIWADKIISGEKSFGPVIDEFVFGLKKQTPANSSRPND
jgi:uridine kinase